MKFTFTKKNGLELAKVLGIALLGTLAAFMSEDLVPYVQEHGGLAGGIVATGIVSLATAFREWLKDE